MLTHSQTLQMPIRQAEVPTWPSHGVHLLSPSSHTISPNVAIPCAYPNCNLLVQLSLMKLAFDMLLGVELPFITKRGRRLSDVSQHDRFRAP